MMRNWLATPCAVLMIGLFALSHHAATALAGGGGQNMLIVVDPGDENAVRIANAYQQIRGIPDANFVFIEPPRVTGYPQFHFGGDSELKARLLGPIAQAIADRGLEGQIDYIGTLGQPHRFQYERVAGNNTYTREVSVQYGLMNLTNIPNHGEGFYYGHESRIYQAPGDSFYSGPDDLDAIRHNDVHQFVGKNYQYYMAGTVGYTGRFGNTADQVIASLARTAQADGTKPVGTIYFEENDDIRSTTREPQWDWVKEKLDDRGIAWVESRNTPGSTPLNRDDVRGAVIGKSGLTLPNGSTYLPGSWADNLTSWGTRFDTPTQTKATEFIAAGAAGSSGTVWEPGATASRFPNGSIHVYYADGATLGEAYYKSVQNPDMQMFIGDLLAQPYADVPDVTIDTGPADGQTVSGTVQLGASALLNDPTVATGIERLELYVDGKLVQAVDGDSSNFDLDTTGLSDGVHEVRVVAVNDAAIESEGYTLRHIVVNNHGRSVATVNSSIVTQDQGVANVQVQTAAGDDAVERIELRHLGRVVGQLDSEGGEVAVDAAQLGYGVNQIVPVAIYSDGQEVAGQAIEVVREPDVLGGRTPTSQADRTNGVKVEYFVQGGNGHVSGTDYSGEADVEAITDDVALSAAEDRSRLTAISNPYPDDVTYHPEGIDIDGLGIRFSGQFEVTADNAGEFLFSLFNTNDSARLLIDGKEIVSYDAAASGSGPYWDFSGAVWLGEGEHDLELLVANEDNSHTGYFDVALFYRGADGVTRLAGNGFVYQAIPEPGTAAVLGLLGGGCFYRRPKRRAIGSASGSSVAGNASGAPRLLHMIRDPQNARGGGSRYF